MALSACFQAGGPFCAIAVLAHRTVSRVRARERYIDVPELEWNHHTVVPGGCQRHTGSFVFQNTHLRMIPGIRGADALRKTLLPFGLLLLAARRWEPIVPTDFNPDWTTESHSGNAAPNYAIVYPQDSVNRIDIIMTVDTW